MGSSASCGYLTTPENEYVLLLSFLTRIFDAWHSRPTAAKMITFAIVGLGNTGVNLSVFALAYTELQLPPCLRIC
jgi:NADH dehydrogenase FAD-containing subunit